MLEFLMRQKYLFPTVFLIFLQVSEWLDWFPSYAAPSKITEVCSVTSMFEILGSPSGMELYADFQGSFFFMSSVLIVCMKH